MWVETIDVNDVVGEQQLQIQVTGTRIFLFRLKLVTILLRIIAKVCPFDTDIQIDYGKISK